MARCHEIKVYAAENELMDISSFRPPPIKHSTAKLHLNSIKALAVHAAENFLQLE